jgi:hypothetical protein
MTSSMVLSGGRAILPKPALPEVVVPKGKRGRPARPAQPASREAQRCAAAILEVLAGVRTPPDAAAALSVSLPRYYLWEQRALAGLVSACEPRPVGKGQSPQRRIASLEKEIVRLRQDCARQQALVRAAQRTIGLGPPPPKPVSKAGSKTPATSAAKSKRKRRPVARALKAAAGLRAAAVAEATAAASSSAAAEEVLQRSVEGSSPPPAVPAQAAPAASGQ